MPDSRASQTRRALLSYDQLKKLTGNKWPDLLVRDYQGIFNDTNKMFNDLDVVEEKVDANTESIVALDERVTINESNIESNTENITVNAENIDTNTQDIIALDERVTAIEDINPLNQVTINSVEDLELLLVGGVINYAADTLYIFGAHITHGYEAVLFDGSALQGASNLTLAYTYTGTGVAFTSLSGNSLSLRQFRYSVPNGTVFNLFEPSLVIIDSVICDSCVNIGTITGGGATPFAADVMSFRSVTGQGMVLTGGFRRVTFNTIQATTTSAGVNLIDWTSATLDDLTITGFNASAPTGSFVLVGDSGSVNMNAGRVASIKDNNLSTIDLDNALGGGLTVNDSGYNYQNSTVINSSVIGVSYVASGDSQITDVLQGVEIQIAGTYTSGNSSSQTSSTVDGIITTLNRIEQRGSVRLILDIEKSGGSARDYIFKIKKIPVSTGTAEDVESAFTTKNISSGDSVSIAIGAPVTYIDGDQFFAVVVGVDTDNDIEAVTANLEVF